MLTFDPIRLSQIFRIISEAMTALPEDMPCHPYTLLACKMTDFS